MHIGREPASTGIRKRPMPQHHNYYGMKRKAAGTVKMRTLLLLAFVALMGAAVAAPQALAAPSEVKLEIAEHCYFAEWACWNVKGNDPEDIRQIQPFTIAQGGTISFEDKEARYPTDVLWKGTAPNCTPGVPVTPPTKTNWSGTCTFANPGDYHFESQELFDDGTFNYRNYEVVVVGPPTPTATTEQATAVTETEATLNGDVNPEGQTTTYYFEYGTTTAYGSQTTETSAGGAGRVSATLTGLSPNTTYDVQLVAVYGAGKTKVEGGNMTFKTAAPPSAPTASTQPATGVTETEATLKGTVNPDGEATEYFFEYGTSTSFGQQTGEVTLPTSESDQAVSATIKGLAPGTEYHFRVVAKNKLGSVPGTDITFTTASTPPAKEPAKEPTGEPSPTSPTSTSGGNPTATTSSTPSTGQPQAETASGPLFGSVKVASLPHGGAVHGSLVVSSVGSEGRLQIELLAKGAAAPLGKLVRSSLHAGKLTFELLPNAKGKAALRHHGRLTLMVKITLTPVHGAAATITRSVVIRA